jgi:hypothetical protein
MSCYDDHHHQSVTIDDVSPETSPHRSRLLPGVINADTVHSLNLSTDLRYLLIVNGTINARFLFSHIPLSRRTTSSITSRLALAIIWITCRSWPPPIRTPPPCAPVCETLYAPDNAVSVPANADVDHDGRFADRGDAAA